jgi:hypothetical protein
MQPRTPSAVVCAVASLVLGWSILADFQQGETVASAATAPATRRLRSLEDYRRFRSLHIDLVGRFPSRDELSAFEDPSFDENTWVDAHLSGSAYSDRLTRVYMDPLRLEVGNAVTVTPQATTLRRIQILGPDGKPEYVYYRRGQRRKKETTDGEFCLSEGETGLELLPNQPPKGTPIPVKKATLDEATVLIKPWWLYQDYAAHDPKARYGEGSTLADPAFLPGDKLLKEPDGSSTLSVRVCREEAQAGQRGTVYASGRPLPQKGIAPVGRRKPAPQDDKYAKDHKGEPLSCRNALAVTSSVDCGCGVGLEHCLPGDSDGNDPGAFAVPTHSPLGPSLPLPSTVQSVSTYSKLFWTQEALRFFDRIFSTNRDFREVLTGSATLVNGPLAQYYRATSRASCCNRERAFGLNEELSPLFDPEHVPDGLGPADISRWMVVEDRGTESAGLLTMPVFLEKFASRRARAAAVYATFWCKSFTSTAKELTPSTEPNLMERTGCAGCHKTLEPLAAYFSRVEETSTVFLPAREFPIDDPRCKLDAKGKAPGFCAPFYDPAFSTTKAGKLRGAYASAANAEAGPKGLAKAVVASPEFARCAVERVTQSFLGRDLSSDDEPLVASLTRTFVASSYRMRGLVSAIVRSDAYRSSNNQRSTSSLKALPKPGEAPNDDVHGGVP